MTHRKYKQEKQRFYYDKGARSLPDANPGEPVQVYTQNQWKKGVIIEKSEEPRSYMVKMKSGNTWRRNRRSFRKIQESDLPADHEEYEDDETGSELSSDENDDNEDDRESTTKDDHINDSRNREELRTRYGRISRRPDFFNILVRLAMTKAWTTKLSKKGRI